MTDAQFRSSCGGADSSAGSFFVATRGRVVPDRITSTQVASSSPSGPGCGSNPWRWTIGRPCRRPQPECRKVLESSLHCAWQVSAMTARRAGMLRERRLGIIGELRRMRLSGDAMLRRPTAQAVDVTAGRDRHFSMLGAGGPPSKRQKLPDAAREKAAGKSFARRSNRCSGSKHPPRQDRCTDGDECAFVRGLRAGKNVLTTGKACRAAGSSMPVARFLSGVGRDEFRVAVVVDTARSRKRLMKLRGVR